MPVSPGRWDCAVGRARSAQSPAAVEEILDRENKRMADSLASKVTRLKSLALDIDRDAEDQNRYLDSMVRVCSVRGHRGQLCPMLPAVPAPGVACGTCVAVVEALPLCDLAGIPPSGLGFHKHDRPAHGEREALFHNGEVWARQPEASVWYGRGPHRGLLHPLLSPVKGKDLSHEELTSVGAWCPRLRGPTYKIVL
ncbi:BET1-like protein isoform X3 [Enhydra lutris kenyoni]|uniref:BET1-like protein isoform X3 n=1 Tax=Enhydra lutris kenyoni TaxID=391180 RepID=A0A2Y9JUW5_ENHLU|nr:BET1-like protein isoform X3 [Enhydra lutris kenyoni]